MKTLLRSVFTVEPSDDVDLFGQNYQALLSSSLGADVSAQPEDVPIWKHVQEFYGAHGHVPSIQSMSSHFRSMRQDDVVDRLERLAMGKPRTRGDFANHLEDVATERRNTLGVNLAKDVAQISTSKLEIVDGRGNKRVLQGAEEGLDWVLAHADELRKPGAPEPLDYATEPPAFPLEVLPDTIRDFAAGVARETCTPLEMAAMYSITILASCAQRSRRLEVHPGWHEQLGLYFVGVLASGELKSPLVRRCTAPIEAWEADQREPHRIARAEHAARLESSKARSKDKGLSEDERHAAMLEAAELEESPPVRPRITADDATPEALATLAASQHGSISVLSTEGSTLRTLTGIRYSRDKASNLGHLLKLYSGDSITIDRKSAEPILIPRPSGTLGVTVQPSVLRAISEIPGAQDEGLIPRMLFAVPRSLVGTRDFERAQWLDDSVAARWDETVRGLLKLPATEDRAVIRCSEAARAKILRLKQKIEERESPGGDLRGMAEWANKLAGNIARIAALFALAQDPLATVLLPGDVERAEQLVEFLIGHARAAYRIGALDANVERAQHVLEWIERTCPSHFSRRDVQRGLHGRLWLHTSKDLDAPLAMLVERRWIRAVQPAPTGGRPASPTYVVLVKPVEPVVTKSPDPEPKIEDRLDRGETVTIDTQKPVEPLQQPREVAAVPANEPPPPPPPPVVLQTIMFPRADQTAAKFEVGPWRPYEDKDGDGEIAEVIRIDGVGISGEYVFRGRDGKPSLGSVKLVEALGWRLAN